MANKPEEICVSFGAAKRLHEAGIIVESYFHWVSSIYASEEASIKYPDLVHTEADMGQYYCKDHKGQPALVLLQMSDSDCRSIINVDYEPVRFDFPAPTADELKGLLRSWIRLSRYDYKLHINLRYNGLVEVYYWCYQIRENALLGNKPTQHEKLCEAFAETIITVKEMGHEPNRED